MPRAEPTRSTRRRARHRGVALFLACLLAATAAAAERRGTVSGTVTDLAGEPLPGVEVTLTGAGQAAASATTDGQGRFSLSVAAGDYGIAFAREGYAGMETRLDVEAGGRHRVEAQLLDAAAGRRRAAAEPFNRAAAAYKAGDLVAAREGFEAALAADPSLTEARRLLAEIHLGEGAWSEAAGAAEDLLAADPEDRQARLVAYEAYRGLGDEARVVALRRALATDPELAPRLARQAFNEGALAAQAEDAATAAARFSEALELDAGLAAAHFAMANLHHRARRHEEALAALARGLELEPASAQGRRLAFAIHDARGDAQAAGEAMRAYAEVDPDGAVAILFERAEAYFEAGTAAAARAVLDRLLEIRPDHAAAHRLLGLAWLADDTAAARRHLERFLELAPDDPEASVVAEILASLE